MLTFLVRRLMLAVPVLLGVVFVVMLTVELIPGDAVALMLGEHATPEAVAKLRDYLGLDKPMLVRYVEYVGRVARGDLGRSIQQNRPVLDELADVWPATLELTVAALLIAAVVGVLAGLVSAVWPTSLFDAVARIGSLFGLSMPVFWTGLVLIVVFAFWLSWLPVGGAGTPAHLVLPAVTLALPSVAMVARMTRSSVLDVLRERGFETKEVAERWLSKAIKHGVLVDVIFRSSRDILLGDQMFERAEVMPFRGRMVRIAPPEDLVVMKACAMSEDTSRYWYDAVSIIAHSELDWDYLVARAREHGARRLLSLLLFATSLDIVVPSEPIETLYDAIGAGRPA